VTTEERPDRIEHVTAGLAEQLTTVYENGSTLLWAGRHAGLRHRYADYVGQEAGRLLTPAENLRL